jgi:hypothetical protein
MRTARLLVIPRKMIVATTVGRGSSRLDWRPAGRQQPAGWLARPFQAALAFGRGQLGHARRLAEESLRLAAHGHENMRTLTAALLFRSRIRWSVTARSRWSLSRR